MKEFDYADAQMLEVLYQYKLEDLDNIKEEEREVANEYKVNSKETSRMLTQINSKMMRAKNRKKKPWAVSIMKSNCALNKELRE